MELQMDFLEQDLIEILKDVWNNHPIGFTQKSYLREKELFVLGILT